MRVENLSVILKEVTDSDCTFLYELLGERDREVNISHKKMPSYDKHVEFVKNRPYSKWYVIYDGDQKAGSIYLTKQNEIGLFIKKEMQGRGIGKKALQLLMKYEPRDRYLANVNPENIKSIEFFKKNNFHLIQYTFALQNNENT
jgi:RimJ/RimL family protein N-acetyltransferase